MGVTDLEGMTEDQQKTLVLISDACEQALYAGVPARTVAECLIWVMVTVVRNRRLPTNLTKQQVHDLVEKQWECLTLAMQAEGEQPGPSGEPS